MTSQQTNRDEITWQDIYHHSSLHILLAILLLKLTRKDLNPLTLSFQQTHCVQTRIPSLSCVLLDVWLTIHFKTSQKHKNTS